MAGMLPGVECARRRRCHQGGAASESSSSQNLAGHNRTRRPSFCLYTSNFDAHINTSSSLLRNQNFSSFQQTEKLEGVAREAKERLDERLRNQRKSSETIKRESSQESKKREKAAAATAAACGSSAAAAVSVNGSSVNQTTVEVSLEAKNKSSNNLKKSLASWAKSSGRLKLLWEQDECAVCLEQFATGENLMHLPCSHRFHSRCLVPWLESNAHCPCCRMPT